MIPVIGPVFAVPLLGFWLTAAVLAGALSYWGERGLQRAKAQRALSQFSATDTPFNRGKLGAMLVSMGRFKKAQPHLHVALEALPNRADWHYRLGESWLRTGHPDRAIACFKEALELDPDCAYGQAALFMGESQLEVEDWEACLQTLAAFEQRHGPQPMSAFLRGKAYWRAGKREQAQATWAGVADIAAGAAKYQKREAAGWVWRARLARWGVGRG